DQGGILRADWIASNAIVQPLLGRPIAGGLPNVTINLAAPGQVWGDRVNELDLRVSKILRAGRARTNVGVDVYNLLNSAAVLTYNQTYSPTVTSGPTAWLAPPSVLTPPLAKISLQLDFLEEYPIEQILERCVGSRYGGPSGDDAGSRADAAKT